MRASLGGRRTEFDCGTIVRTPFDGVLVGRQDAEPMKRTLLLSTLLAIAPFTQAALPGDSAEGKKLYDANCTGCHNSSVYTRPDHQIKSLPALKQQLNECTHAAQVTLTDAQQQSLVRYLNEQFYKLGK
jgi:hypothetical protein